MALNSKKKEKLLVVTDYFYPHWTGVSKSIYNLVRSTADEYDITILTVAHKKNLKKQEVIFSSNIIREPYLFTLSRSQYSLSIVIKFFSLVKTADVVLVNSPSANLLPLSIIAKLFGKKLLVFHQGDIVLPAGIINKIIEKIFDASALVAFFLSNKVSTYTKDYAEHSRVLKPFLNKLHPIILPIYLEKNKKKEPFLEMQKNEIRFGFGGRFVEEKGFDVLFKAIPLIKEQLPNAKFYFAGKAEMEYENFFKKNIQLFDKVKKDVVMLGLLDERKLNEFYQSIDFMIVPSRSDCFNIMQAEALISGTPCIVSDIPGLRFAVKTSGFGVLFKSESPDDLAEKALYAVAKQKEIMVCYPKVLSLLDNKANVEKIKKFITE